jgi:hypothetical protein
VHRVLTLWAFFGRGSGIRLSGYVFFFHNFIFDYYADLFTGEAVMMANELHVMIPLRLRHGSCNIHGALSIFGAK